MLLVGGGSRSGKTRFAIDHARSIGSRLAYVATAELLDPEMHQRAAAHRSERGPDFTTIEEPTDVAGWIRRHAGEFDAVVVDCLTLWVSNLLLSGTPDLTVRAADLADAAAVSPSQVIFVTNEVGAGIVPENELARQFRDQAGWVNQAIANRATEVYWMVFGCPLKVKG
jgi:adenosylcobinamide kinase/adenosylcobinamide-phosphate guanylyltransferase